MTTITDFIDRLIGVVPWQTIAISLAILLFAIFTRKIFTRYILKILARIVTKTKTRLDDKLLHAFEKPLRTFIAILGLYFAIINFDLPSGVSLWITRFFRSTLIIIFASGLYRSVPVFIAIGGRFNDQINEILTKFLTKTAQSIIIALSVLVIAAEWGFDVNGFIAGLGLGGLAVAFAAKDSLANLFAGVVLITGKIFAIGDWIQTGNIQGVVEDITLRSTKIRSFGQAVVTIPNANLANEAITNWTEMGKREVTFRLPVTYQTTREQLERCVDQIEKMLHDHTGIDKELIVVNFDTFGESGFELYLYFYTGTTVWYDYLAVKQDINLKIMEILEQENVEIALPSRSLYFATSREDEDEEGVPSSDNREN